MNKYAEERFKISGYETDEPCIKCGKRPARLEPRFYYAFCIDHMDTPPTEMCRVDIDE